jgi:hypothetical protein
MQRTQFNTVIHPADTGGCAFYRMRSPAMAAQTLRKDISIIDSPKMIATPDFYRDIRHVKVQRQVSPQQREFIAKFLKPMSDSVGFWLSYDIDDVIGPDDIPMYNAARGAFQAPGLEENIKEILNMVDFITVVTEEMAKYYHIKFGVPMNRIQVVPNYLPRWWIGAAYDIMRIEEKFEAHKNKHRIGFVCSSTHFDLKNQNEGNDDFTHIIPYIKDTVDKYQWVFIGGLPQQLVDLTRAGKIEYHQGADLFNYPRTIMEKKLDCIVAPLQDNIFNRCKSNIKLLEGWALGLPVIAQDLEPYQPYTDMLFKDSTDLDKQLTNLFKSKNKYLKIVKSNRKTIDYGDAKSKNGWWLEKNMGFHFGSFMIPQKTMSIDLTNPAVTERIRQAKEAEKLKTMNVSAPMSAPVLNFDRKEK